MTVDRVKLKITRINAGLSLRELARRTGLSSAQLSRLETGENETSRPAALKAIADALSDATGERVVATDLLLCPPVAA